ncbi:hypothetical protein GQX74_009713 [Glossina fuscipes]|nr:hypothetical protein GQX74_009713 [Glossina fuscipes]
MTTTSKPCLQKPTVFTLSLISSLEIFVLYLYRNSVSPPKKKVDANVEGEKFVRFSLVINNCLKVGYFPLAWKRSFIISLYKNCSRDNMNNYAGITKLSILAKLVGALLAARLAPKISYHQIFAVRKQLSYDYGDLNN